MAKRISKILGRGPLAEANVREAQPHHRKESIAVGFAPINTQSVV